MLTLPDHLRHYHEIGAPVFPVYEPVGKGICSCRDGRVCANPGKHPRTYNGLNDASTDPAEVVDWWRQWPKSNVGVRTGVAFDVLDIDSPEALGQLQGLLVRKYGAGADEINPGDNPVSTTGRGWHIAFPITNHKNQVRMGGIEGVDWRGTGGYIVAPPSTHHLGQTYRWSHWGELQPPSDPLLELLTKTGPFTPPPRQSPLEGPVSPEVGQEGFWYPETRYRMLRAAVEGERNDVLNRVAFLLGLESGHAPDSHAVAVALRQLESIALGLGLSATEVTKTIQSGYESGREERQ